LIVAKSFFANVVSIVVMS